MRGISEVAVMDTYERLLRQFNWQRYPLCVDRRVVRSERPRRGKRGKRECRFLAGQVFPPSCCYTTWAGLSSLVVCGVGVHFVGRGCSPRMAVVGPFGRQGAPKGKGERPARGRKPTRRARPVGHTRILGLPTPQVVTVGPCSQFLFHVSDSSVLMACFKIALCLRL